MRGPVAASSPEASGSGGVMRGRFAGSCGSYTPCCSSGSGLSAAHGGTGAASAESVSKGGAPSSREQGQSSSEALKFIPDEVRGIIGQSSAHLPPRAHSHIRRNHPDVLGETLQ